MYKWLPEYSCSNESIDDDHKKLFDILNKLLEAMKERKSKEVLGQIILELSKYSEEHFEREEKIFLKSNYPNKDIHIQKHKEFVEKVNQLYKDYNSGKIALSLDTALFIKDWLVNHILKTDKEYSKYIEK